MTLALHGKSKQRQAGLAFVGIMAVVVAMLIAVTVFPRESQATEDTGLSADVQTIVAPVSFKKSFAVVTGGFIYWTIEVTNSTASPISLTIYDPGTELSPISSNTCSTFSEVPAEDKYTCTVNESNYTRGFVVRSPYSPPAGFDPKCDTFNVSNWASILGDNNSSQTAQYNHQQTAQSVNDCIKVTKTKDETVGTWNITLENKNGFAVIVFVKDAGATFLSTSVAGACDGLSIGDPLDAGVSCLVQAESSLILNVHKAVPVATCAAQPLGNTVQVWTGTVPPPAGAPANFTVAADAFTIGAVASPSCITAVKTYAGKDLNGDHQWTITFTNSGPTAAVNFSDTYEDGLTDTNIVSVKDGASDVACTASLTTTDFRGGCDVQLAAAGAQPSVKAITVTTDGFTCGRVSNRVDAYFGPGGPGGPGTKIGELGSEAIHEETDCTQVIKLCKVWLPNAIINGATTFDFEASDSSQEIPAVQNVSVPNVVEGDPDGSCILLQVSPGEVSLKEIVPDGFIFDGWSFGSGGDQDLAPPYYDANPVSFQCRRVQDEGLLRELTDLVRDIMELVVEVQQGAPVCTITAFNHDDGITLNNGSIRVEKYNDLNGNGVLDAGEPPLANWDMTFAGPEENGTFATDANGQYSRFGLTTNDVYTITEETQPGWSVTRAYVNGASQGATSSVGAVVPNGGFTVVRFLNQQKGSILVHKVAATSHNGGGDVFAPNDDDGWSITVSSVQCGVSVTLLTDANGDALFQGLPMCSDYKVKENQPNAGSPGFVIVGSDTYLNQTPGAGSPNALTFLNRKTTSDPPCTSGCTQTTPTPVTPTATPVTPTAAPTTPAAGNTPPVTNVAGERTPGASSTPIAPSTGDAFIGGSGNNLGLVLMLGGFLALTSGLGVVALGRRR